MSRRTIIGLLSFIMWGLVAGYPYDESRGFESKSQETTEDNVVTDDTSETQEPIEELPAVDPSTSEAPPASEFLRISGAKGKLSMEGEVTTLVVFPDVGDRMERIAEIAGDRMERISEIWAKAIGQGLNSATVSYQAGLNEVKHFVAIVGAVVIALVWAVVVAIICTKSTGKK